jgi:hypothetical protein
MTPHESAFRSGTRPRTSALLTLAITWISVGCGGSDARPVATDAGAGTGGNDAPANVDGGPASGATYGDGLYTGIVNASGGVVEVPAEPDWSMPVVPAIVGKSYAETSYQVLAPASLAKAFNALVSGAGSARVFANDFRAADDGVAVRYGALSPDDQGKLAWQDPDTARTFRVAQALDAPSVLVSEPFTYTLEAHVMSPLSSTGRYVLRLEAVNAVWTVTMSDDLASLADGRLYGVVTRREAEQRPLTLGALCPLVCGLSSTACGGSGVTTLAGLLDCTDTARDADVDGDGEPDGYRLAIAFTSSRIPFDAAGE